MNLKYFLIGIGFILAGYILYRGIKDGPSSEKNNWQGPTLSLYVQGWGTIILCVIAGVVMIFKSLLAQI